MDNKINLKHMPILIFLSSSQLNTKEKDFLNNEEASKNINARVKSPICKAMA